MQIDFSPLLEELDHWGEAGQTASLWVRDDDATRPGPALQRLFDSLGGVPLGLAVIPADDLDASLGLHLPRTAQVLQHGYHHLNHAPDGEKSAEFGAHRSKAEMLHDIRQGHIRLEAAFGPVFVPVFVPPWNRIAPELCEELPSMGFRGVSQHRDKGVFPSGLVRADTHMDPVDWRNGRGFIGPDVAVNKLTHRLRKRRKGKASGPVGVLTHHKDMTEDCWAFLAELFKLSHSSMKWLLPSQIFPRSL